MASSTNDAQLKWLSQCEEDVVQDDLTQLISETRGVMEKLAVRAIRRGPRRAREAQHGACTPGRPTWLAPPRRRALLKPCFFALRRMRP